MEDFIFDDDVDEVGAEVEAHCPKCKADTQHVVISKYEDEIRRVQCNPCGDVHPYRKPRGESEDEAEPTPAAKKKAAKAKPTWEQVMAKHAKKQPKPYQLGEYFKEMEVISHPKFGVGFVTENIGDDKIEVNFKEDKRVLVHNRKGLTLPFMRPIVQAGKGKGKKGAAAPVAPPPPAPAAKGKAAPAKAAKPAPVAKAKPAPAAKGKAAAKKPSKPAAKPKAAARTAAKKPATRKPPAKKVKRR
jgi:hypothetical protein